jgi:hypothetical protein
MSFFGISIPALRAPGGLIVARVGFGMLDPHDPDEARARTEPARLDVAVTIGMAAGAESWADHLAIAAGIALVVGASWLVLRSARTVKRLLGEQGVDALTRIMGFLLVCIGLQFVGIAVIEVASDPRFLAPIVETLERIRRRLSRCKRVGRAGDALEGQRRGGRAARHRLLHRAARPDVSRAQRRAQRKALARVPYDHPGYWSPFLLIGSWL